MGAEPFPALAPCPRCGRPPGLRALWEARRREFAATVACANCGFRAEARCKYGWLRLTERGQARERAARLAAKRWNGGKA